MIRRIKAWLSGNGTEPATVVDISPDGFVAHHDRCWNALTDRQRRGLIFGALGIVREMDDENFSALRTAIAEDPAGWATPVHFYWGMAVRNGLRERGCYDDQYPTQNLDDYYVRAVEEAVKLRSAELTAWQQQH